MNCGVEFTPKRPDRFNDLKKGSTIVRVAIARHARAFGQRAHYIRPFDQPEPFS
jgi:hypothetical protein